MKLKHTLIALSALALVLSCAPKPVTTPEPYQVTSEDELFSRAETLFESASYDEALALYDQYLRQNPDKPLAAAALMKIGIIRALKQDYEGARTAFRNILSTHRRSFWRRVDTIPFPVQQLGGHPGDHHADWRHAG